MSRVDAKL